MLECANPSSKRRDPALVTLGEALRGIRSSKGNSQERLALLAEVDRRYVGRVERGDNNAANLALQKLAKALDVPLAGLMRGGKL